MILEGTYTREGKGRYDLERLRELQRKIASRVIIEDSFKIPVRAVTGFDLAYLDDEAVAAAVTMDYRSHRVIEEKTLVWNVSFPYVPTFLCFREGPPIIRLMERLKVNPDVLIVNAHGVAHPLFCGCASYVGVLVDKPTIGVAGSMLCGDYCGKPREVGEWVPLTYEGRTVGAVLLSKRNCKPIFVSVGHKISLGSAIEIVKRLLLSHRFPEPLRLAHVLANKVKRSLKLEARVECRRYPTDLE
ncbi:endonuclease V [Candidatus Bathyarchaeota archaeon]|nr:endonuclease V [Candidatus Bathyarchaeota archaeon]